MIKNFVFVFSFYWAIMIFQFKNDVQKKEKLEQAEKLGNTPRRIEIAQHTEDAS